MDEVRLAEEAKLWYSNKINGGIPLTGLAPICSIGECGGLSENLGGA